MAIQKSKKMIKTILNKRNAIFLFKIQPVRNFSILRKPANNNLIRRGFASLSPSDERAGGGIKNSEIIRPGQRQVSAWLFLCAGMVFAMVVLGGITRLTRSGLSMTKWRFLGEEYPKDEEMWEAEFELYKMYPEYKRINSEMTLSEFKKIYFNEYLHRMFGRSLGVVFGIPFAYFGFRGFLNRQILKRLSLLFLLGGSQGLIGWWMVKSGLDEKPSTHLDLPRVSPYRLATHLVSAFAIYLLLLKTALICVDNELVRRKRFSSFGKPSAGFRRKAIFCGGLAFLTAVSGAFVAGTEAGFIHNTFPFMGPGGQIVPKDYFNRYIEPAYLNVFENQSAVQFNHRALGTLTASFSAFLFVSSLCSPLPPLVRKAAFAVFFASFLQVHFFLFWLSSKASLGIATLINHIPTPLAAMHQSGALVLLTCAFVLIHLLSPRRHALAKFAQRLKQ